MQFSAISRTRVGALLARFAIAAVGVAFISAQGCTDRSVDPRPKVREYFFYGSDISGDQLLRFSPSSGKLDTLLESDSGDAGFLRVSARGEYLYRVHDGDVEVYTANAFQLIRTLPYKTDVVASRDGKMLAMVLEHSLHVLRLPAYTEIYANDTLRMDPYRPSFSFDSKVFYYVDGETTTVKRLDATDGFRPLPELVIPGVPGGVIQVAPSNDDKLLFLYSIWNSSGYAFSVYDVMRDSILYQQILTPGAGSLLVSPDGRYVFFTNPGTFFPGPTPPSAFYIYDIATNTVDEISTLGLAQDSLLNRMPIGPIAISPDGRTLVAVRANLGFDLVTYDPLTKSMKDYFYYKLLNSISDIQCQTSK